MRILKAIYLSAFVLFCLAPIAVISLISITSTRAMTFPPDGFSLQWYAKIFLEQDWFDALQNSFIIAISSSTLAALVAFPLSYMAWRYKLRYARALISIGILPFMLPPVLIALGFLVLFTWLEVYGAFFNGVIAHTIFLLALPLVMISLGLEGIKSDLLEAGSTMGAADRQLFTTVTLPLVLPYVVASMAFCMVLSLNEYIVLLMTIGFSYETLPIKVFNAMRYGYSPILASIAVFFLMVNFVVFGAIAIFGNLPRLLGALDQE